MLGLYLVLTVNSTLTNENKKTLPAIKTSKEQNPERLGSDADSIKAGKDYSTALPFLIVPAIIRCIIFLAVNLKLIPMLLQQKTGDNGLHYITSLVIIMMPARQYHMLVIGNVQLLQVKIVLPFTEQ